MLIYIDAPKFIKVYRVDESAAGSKRVPLGVIIKNTYEFRQAPGMSRTSAEQDEIGQVVEHYRQAWISQVASDVKRFPVIAREVTEYYALHASELEKRLISTSALELIRAIRKIDKEGKSR